VACTRSGIQLSFKGKEIQVHIPYEWTFKTWWCVKQAGNKQSLLCGRVESIEPESSVVLSKWVEGDIGVCLVHSNLKALKICHRVRWTYLHTFICMFDMVQLGNFVVSISPQFDIEFQTSHLWMSTIIRRKL
jgi:hypothetical protein